MAVQEYKLLSLPLSLSSVQYSCMFCLETESLLQYVLPNAFLQWLLFPAGCWALHLMIDETDERPLPLVFLGGICADAPSCCINQRIKCMGSSSSFLSK
jgi:hypothetical protein